MRATRTAHLFEAAIVKCICLLLLFASMALGADPGSISGRIVSAAGAGAAVPNAPVEAKNLDTKAAYKVSSSSDGSYELSGLPAGMYEISIENMFPFVPFHQGSVQVEAGRTTRLDIRLNDVNLNTLGDGGEQFAQALADKPVVSV